MNEIVRFAPAGCPDGINPRTWRQSIEARINELLDQSFALITMLDMMEVDPDFEPNGDDEPSLGWTGDGRGTVGLDKSMTYDDDREADTCDDEDGADTEANGDELDSSWTWEDTATGCFNDPLAPVMAREALKQARAIRKRMEARI